jgi:spermidine synthase
LGSSTYSFGIILALALAGIGLGGLTYRIGLAPRSGASSLGVFSLISALQAFWMVLPYALGDRVAIVGFYVNELRSFGFGGQIGGWSLIGAMLVLLPSYLAGLQFPLLVSLLGAGRAEVGRQMGNAYAWNTGGAIAGALLGGFLLIPVLTAPGCWQLATWFTLALSGSAWALGRRGSPRWVIGSSAVIASAALWLSLATLGPTATWRHTPIGYGRVTALPDSPNKLQEWIHHTRWRTRQEFEGRESSIALTSTDGYAFYVNGKSDGAAIGDAATQVMLGMVSAVLHPEPRSACVVGLGTGSSAGWLADVPGMDRVDVIEIEPQIGSLARDFFAPVNRNVMAKPNVRVILGDAREALIVRGPPYDLIVSEPSNPYRAGIPSLYTREFYESVRQRLNPGGIFSQWVQGYEIDTPAVRLVYATLAAVFPHVETWVTQPTDLLFVCHLAPPAYTREQIQRKITTPPFDEALRRVWFTDSVEGFLARHFAAPELARDIARQEKRANTDDANLLEYGFARALTRENRFAVNDILKVALSRELDRPVHLREQIAAGRLLEERMLLFAAEDAPFNVPAELEGEARARAQAIAAYVDEDFARVMQLWRGEAQSPMAQLILVEAVSRVGQPEQARPMLEWIRQSWPLEARLAAAWIAARHGSDAGALEHLKEAFTAYRNNPWVRPRVVRQGLVLARQLAGRYPKSADALFELVAEPFCMTAEDLHRLEAMLDISRQLPPQKQIMAADAWGLFPPWTQASLQFRRDAYAAGGDARLRQAQRELDAFMELNGASFAEAALMPGSAAAPRQGVGSGAKAP